jgi:hypothetical protein
MVRQESTVALSLDRVIQARGQQVTASHVCPRTWTTLS